MCLELIEYITLDAHVEGQLREIYIYYMLLDEPLKTKEAYFKAYLRYLSTVRKCGYHLARGQQPISMRIWIIHRNFPPHRR